MLTDLVTLVAALQRPSATAENSYALPHQVSAVSTPASLLAFRNPSATRCSSLGGFQEVSGCGSSGTRPCRAMLTMQCCVSRTSLPILRRLDEIPTCAHPCFASRRVSGPPRWGVADQGGARSMSR
eukprot:2279282-Pleurochrysis_carterae.AAC.1